MLTALAVAAFKALLSAIFGAGAGAITGALHDRAIRKNTQIEDQEHADEKTIQQQQEELAIANRPDAAPADELDRMRSGKF